MKKFRKLRIPAFFLLLFVLYWKAPDYVGENTATRIDLTKAIVFDHSFQIDNYVKNTGDWSQRDGHYYTNKAPGSSLLLVPFYYAFVAVEKARGLDPLEHELDLANIRRTDLFVTALPSVLLCFLFLGYLLSKVSLRGPPGAPGTAANSNDAWVVLFTYAVATIAFPYSTMLWGHQTAAAFLFSSFICLRKNKYGLGGLLAATAVLTEYSTFLGVTGLGFYILFADGASGPALKARMGALVKFVAGAVPILVIFVAYHKICFGGWFALPLNVHFLNPALVVPDDSEKLLGVLGVPSFEALYGILVSTERGLFYLSPVLLIAFTGFYRWFRVREERGEALLAAWIVFSGVWFNMSFKGWHGGWCVGPRYLVPILPFLVASLIWVKPGKVFYILLAVSALNMLAIVSVDMQPPRMTNTLTEKIYADLLTRKHLWPKFTFLTMIAGLLFALVRLGEPQKEF